jgi:UDP-N-acetyl-D-galactosamine dehydrogenase
MNLDVRIGVIGLGYVGLPVAISLARKFPVIGYDVDPRRISALRECVDWTGEIEPAELQRSNLLFADTADELADRNFFVVAVPTPVDESKSPDFSLLRSACQTIGPVLRPGSIVVFESTVYPGATEEICGPALEAASGLRCGEDFKLAYSPERINPGDKERPLEQIVKIVSGQDEETLEVVAAVYGSIIQAGIHRASSIKVAEAAKVLENTQRDINIALMNETSKICDLIGIPTSDVLKAAGTKWNFLNFTPGLVGGHCIGVDPYYLTSKAAQLGYHPEVILAGRRINDSMPSYVVNRILRMLAQRDIPISRAKVGILGITFKENVPDIRNSKVADLYQTMIEYGIQPHVCDPFADPEETHREYGIELESCEGWSDFDAIVFAVPHQPFLDDIHSLVERTTRSGSCVIDLRSMIARPQLPQHLSYWAL